MLKRLLCLFCSLVGGLTGYSYQIWTDPDTQISWCYTVANSEITLGQGKDGLGGIGGVAVIRNITGELQIPEKVAGCPVVELGERSFSGTTTSGMTSVIIPGTVRRICANAFMDCKRLASVSFRDGLVSIGRMAFDGCESLRSITFPTSLKEIGEWAFSRCTSLREVKFNEGLMSVAEWAFSECSSLVSVELPSSVISIDQYSFAWCSNLLVCRSDEGLETIGECAFSGCSNLECVDLPRSLCEIGDDAFAVCWKLNNMIFHGDVPNGFTKSRVEDGGKYYTGMTVFYPLKYGQYWQRVANDMPTVSFSAIQGTACDVVFDGNGGFPAVTETVQDVGSCYLFPSSCPERTGYKFDGWWTDRTGGVRVTDENYVVRMTKHALYAQWKKCEVIATEAAFHLDASDEVSMIIVTNGAERLVARWSDMYARSNYAEADTSLPALGEFHGKTIVDFGANVTGCDGNGAWLRWLVADASIREVFVVCCDHVTVNPESAERQFLLSCDLNDFSCDFHRDGRKLFSTQNASDKIKNGLVQVDGLTVPYDYVLPGGWHVVHIRTTGEVVANTFAKDRTCRYGGLRIAEVIVYDVTLDDTSADIVQRHLMNKWLGQDPLYKVEFNAMGGSPSPSPLSKASGEAYGELPEVQRAGYDFAGWWTASDGGVRVGSADVVQESITLYAHWRSSTDEVSILNVEACQQYPQSGLVDITVTFQGASNAVAQVECVFVATNSATKVAIPVEHITRNGVDEGLGSVWTRKFIWDAKADVGTVKIDDVVLTVDAKSFGGVQLWENGPYWAECNVGASKPEEYGYYFWWGDTVGYKRNTGNDGWITVKDVSIFSFSTGNCPTYGKSNSQLQSEGYVDATGNLVAAHDAATVHLGTPWRMPTDAEFFALIANCTMTWTTCNGVNGRLVSGKADFAAKSIFLPAAGFGKDNSGIFGRNGFYWSSTQSSWGLDDDAVQLVFGSSDLYMNNGPRCSGVSIRPVRGFADVSVTGVGMTTHLTIDCRDGQETCTISFDPMGGTVDEQVRTVSKDSQVGTLPTATREGYEFLGWFTATSGGTQVTAETVVTADVTFYAQWEKLTGEVAISSVEARQRYPWNGLVDIVVTLQGSAADVAECDCVFSATNSATKAAISVEHITRNGDDEASDGAVTRKFIWDATADVGAVKIDDVALMVGAVKLGGVQLWENGPYWAECNVGATKPEEYGYYFWWGDTVGYKRDVTDNGWISVNDASSFLFVEVNCSTYGKDDSQLQAEGYIEAMGNLVAAHDAATAHLSTPWRMPTDAEFAALISSCTATWTKRNGVSGQLFTGKGAYSSKSIFVPAAGGGGYDRLFDRESMGCYWSATPFSDTYDYARELAWGVTIAEGQGCPWQVNFGRYTARSVRPVREFANAGGIEVASANAVTTHLSLDTHTGTRELSSESVGIRYVASWYENGALARVEDNGMVVASGVSGDFAWLPTDGGAHTLKLSVFDGADSLVGSETAEFVVLGCKSITYVNLHGTTHSNPETYLEGTAVTFTPPSERAGYTFTGWIPAAITAEMRGPQTVTARWRANAYQIAYDANGGLGAMADEPMTYDVENELTACAFTRKGYTFAGWAREAATGMSPPQLADGAVVSNLTAEADGVVTLYAVWDNTGLLDEEKTHVDVEKGEVAPYEDAAVVYDGYLYDGDLVVGSVQVKVTKGKTDKKSGVFSAKVTATVQLADGSKKISFKGGIADETGAVTEMTDKNGNTLAVTVGVNGLGGEFRRSRSDAPYQIDGARNVFSGKSAADKAAAAVAASRYQGAYNIVLDGGTLSVSVDKKGKAKIAGTIEGNKVSATSQLLVGEEVAAIPVVITKKVSMAFCLWVMADGTVEARGVDGVIAGKAGNVGSGAVFRMDGAAGVRALPGLMIEYFPEGLSIASSGTKWVVAGGAKAGKLVLVKGTTDIDPVKSKFTDNMSGLKLTYKAKDGSFKGSFKVYNLENGKIKSYTANVTGVMIGDVGYGTATIKKPACTFPIAIE